MTEIVKCENCGEFHHAKFKCEGKPPIAGSAICSASGPTREQAIARAQASQIWETASDETRKQISSFTPQEIFVLGWILARETPNKAIRPNSKSVQSGE